MAGREVGVATGPYRWIRHPNYVAVVAELFALPMIHTAWITAIAGTVANLEILRRRIRVEEQTLLANPAYRVSMGAKPRFVKTVLTSESAILWYSRSLFDANDNLVR